MESKHLYTSDQKIQWFGYGEWVEEPDEVNFEHLGFKCLVWRVVALEYSGYAFGGHLCGYMQIPIDHPWYGKTYDDIDCECHGRLTYSDFGLRGERDGYCIGFDCGHIGDVTPSIDKLMGDRVTQESNEYVQNYAAHRLKYFHPTYKNIPYAIGETKSLAEQAFKAVLNGMD